jgi:hypothetical protein
MTKVDGIVVGPNSPAIGLRGVRSEKAELQLCDDLVARIGDREGVVNLSQQRASMVTIGISDRRYRLKGYAFFWEGKADDGKLTMSQHQFLLEELKHGALAGCGGLQDLQEFVGMLQPYDSLVPATLLSSLRAHCLNLVQRWASKGYRAERRHPRSRR